MPYFVWRVSTSLLHSIHHGVAFKEEEIRNCEERVKKLLEIIPPNGIEFLRSIKHILERERNWVWWKRDGCPPFEKPPLEKNLCQEGTKKWQPRYRLGNRELAQLWKCADQNPMYCMYFLRRHCCVSRHLLDYVFNSVHYAHTNCSVEPELSTPAVKFLLLACDLD